MGGMFRGDRLLAVAGGLFGLLVAFAGASALPDPFRWYLTTPGVAATGPFNPHFVRDIAVAYLVAGAALAAGALWRPQRSGLWLAATLWLAGHAGVHLWETSVGLCTAAQLRQSATGVLVPAVVAVALTAWALSARRRRG